MNTLLEVQQALAAHLELPEGDIAPTSVPISGGDTHQAIDLRWGGGRWFVKLAAPGERAMLEAEADGLAALAATGTIAVPECVLCGAGQEGAWLVLAFETLTTQGDEEALGRGLARLHRHLGKAHGWHQSNWLGQSRQSNETHADWCQFFTRQRLLPQYKTALARGYRDALAPQFEQLLPHLPERLNHAPKPSLLHGDLWSGNQGYRRDGAPVIFDPAVSYGDRETDLAMMTLFGGFGPRVLSAYEQAWELPPGYHWRRQLYQLYHLLNHLNLFGAGWLARVQTQLRALCDEL